MSRYEKHRYNDPELPISLHYDQGKNGHYTRVHWHEPYELLYYTDGQCEMMINGVRRLVQAGDLIFLNSNCVHNFHPIKGNCHYYCLTIDPSLTDDFGLQKWYNHPMIQTRKPELIDLFMQLVQLKKEQPLFFKKEMKAIILQLLIRLFRIPENIPAEPLQLTTQCQMVMKAVDYLQAHFTEPITVEELSNYLGFSKYYFCHQFKEITGQTMVDYLNNLRCKNARRLLSEGQCNVSESARLSGFTNLSYFAKVYKKHMGNLPSKAQK